MIQTLPLLGFPSLESVREDRSLGASVRLLAMLFVRAVGICSGFEICTLKVAFGKQIIPCEFSRSQHHRTILFIQVETPHWFLDVQNSFSEAKYPLQNYSVTKYVLLSPSVPHVPKKHVSLSMDRRLLMYVKLCTHLWLCDAVRRCLRGMTLCEAVSIDIYRLAHLMLVHGPGSFVMCLLKLPLYCIYFFQFFGKKMNCFGLFSLNKCEWETKRVSLCSAQLSVLVSRNRLNHYGIPDSEFTENQPEFLSRWCLVLCFLKKQGQGDAITRCGLHVARAGSHPRHTGVVSNQRRHQQDPIFSHTKQPHHKPWLCVKVEFSQNEG